MAYQKFIVDNTTCSRRFHITFDDATETLSHVSIECPHCGVMIYSEDNHPAVQLAREENLVKTGSLSELVVTDCLFEDKFSKKTIHK